MISLSRHIETLMLTHDCVIVPGLGGFVTHYVSARHVPGEQLFLPPYRSVGFNARLTVNDGLLVQSYMQTYDTTYPETVRLIDDEVTRLKEQLQRDGEYELSGIGRLKLGIGGSYEFIPCEAGVLSPELYGLDAFMQPTVTQNVSSEEGTASSKPTLPLRTKYKRFRLKRTDRDYTLSISKELVNYVVAALVAVVCYFAWATPISSGLYSTPGMQTTASMAYEELFSPRQADHRQTKAEPTNAQQTILPGEQPARTNQQTQVPNEPTRLVNTQAAQPQHSTTAPHATPELHEQAAHYTIVLASSITQENAERMSRQLKAQGHSEVRPYTRGRMVRVIYGKYATEAQAREAMRTLRNKDFASDAWVMHLK